jgi:hypothetical protein
MASRINPFDIFRCYHKYDVIDFAAERNSERDVNPAKLRGVIETFSDPRYRLGLADVEPDFLGRSNTTAAGVIVVLNKSKPPARQGKIVLSNASRRFRKGRPKNYIPDDAVRPLAAAFLAAEPVEGEVATITKEQAERADYNLSPSRWAGGSGRAEFRDIATLMSELIQLDREAQSAGEALSTLLLPLYRGRSSAAAAS